MKQRKLNSGGVRKNAGYRAGSQARNIELPPTEVRRAGNLVIDPIKGWTFVHTDEDDDFVFETEAPAPAKTEERRWVSIDPDLQAATGRVILKARERKGMTLEEWLATEPVIPRHRAPVATPVTGPSSINVLCGPKVALTSSELWNIIDVHYPEADEIVGPKALVSWEQSGYKLTAWAAQAMQNGLPILIIGDSGMKFQAQFIKRLMAMGRDVVYHNRKLDVHGHHAAGRPYHQDDAHSDFYKEFGAVLNAEDDAYWATVPEQSETWATGWAVPEQVADDSIPRWLQATKLESVHWAKQLANGRRYNQDDSTWVPDYDQDVACRILTVDTVPGTRQDLEDLIEFFGALTREFLHENADLCWELWERLGQLEDYFGEAERFGDWMHAGFKKPKSGLKGLDDMDSWEFMTRK